MNSFPLLFLNYKRNLFSNEFNTSKNLIFENNQDEYDSDKSYDEETIPDEDFNKYPKKRDKLMSCPNVEHKGPNINLKINEEQNEIEIKEKKINEEISKFKETYDISQIKDQIEQRKIIKIC